MASITCVQAKMKPPAHVIRAGGVVSAQVLSYANSLYSRSVMMPGCGWG